MKAMSLETADLLHTLQETAKIRYEAVSHAPFEQFSSALRRLRRELIQRELIDHEHWAEVCRPLQRYRFDMSVAPLALNDVPLSAQLGVAALRRWLNTTYQAYGTDLATMAGCVVDLYQQVQSLPDSPLLDRLEFMVGRDGSANVGVLARDSRLIPRIEAALRAGRGTEAIYVLGLSELRSAQFARIFTFGPVRWYPDHVFSVPRARMLDVITYQWQTDRWQPHAAFRGGLFGRSPASRTQPETDPGDRDDAWLGLDLAAIERRAAVALDSDRVHAPEEHELDEARLLLLHAGYAVFIEAGDGATSLVIDLEEDDAARVRRVQTRDIVPGMFILLRTEGSGDYVVPIANKILGSQADALRQAQRMWKGLLRSRVRATGLGRVCGQLRRNGCERADEQNVRNWMSERSIRTQDSADFIALMGYLGLQEQSADIWAKMGLIRNAHQRAGQEIRQKLLEQVAATDLDELERVGTMAFTLLGAEGGQLTAFRVEQATPGLITVAASRLGRPFLSDI